MDILNVIHLSKQIGHTKILSDVSFHVQRGDFVGIIGPNGAGKTTLLKCITGQLVVPKNCVQIFNHDIASDSLSAKKCFGYAFDPSILPVQLTGMQFLELVASARHIDLESSNVSFFIQMLMLESKMNDQIGSYSQGMKQKLSIMSALLGNPSLIILDESLNGLDPISGYHLKNYLKEITQKKESAVILSSQLIDSIEKYCSIVIMLYEGAIRKTWSQEQLAEEKERTQKDLERLFVDMVLSSSSK
jgi:ABC-2 type transport system ATP-binding protein